MTPDEIEAGLLDWFWACAADPADRFGLLRRCTVIVIPRPPEWHAAPHGTPSGDRDDRCFVCLNGDRSLARHHVIPVHNGGSDSLRNLVTICDQCHSMIHGRPLPNLPIQTRGFVSLGDILDKEAALQKWLDGFRRRLDLRVAELERQAGKDAK